ncbi:GerMN domain-containing protein [Frondihabitans cladoniiphilus]|uniref:LpqB family beta-propeller domain-containing protein n=1 Tax=Frondihabitans cladoniiphilus TaxID=715785 RepID=A0ABP8WEW2_9MICO
MTGLMHPFGTRTGARARAGRAVLEGPGRASRARRRLGVPGIALAVALAVAGCADIPTAGPVQTGGTVSDTVQNDVVFFPSGPIADSSQSKIITDFIDAGTGSQNDYAVAREFLTPSFAKKWNPRAGVVVRQGTGSVQEQAPTQSSLTVSTAATVDSSGHYTQAAPSTTTRLIFRFEKVKGQWRLSYAADGIVLSTANFDNVFRPHAVYFFDPTYAYLVPDERWFLARTSTASRVAAALLAGPSPWLRGAVATAFPDGTTLNSVTADSATARVDLSEQAGNADETARSRMRAQLVASFSTIATVSSVDISVDGAALSIPADTGSGVVRDPTVDARPLVLTKGVFGFATPTTVTPIASLSKTVAGLKPTAIELSTRQNTAAVGTDTGVYSVRENVAPTLVDSRPGLVDPSLDDLGFVWSAQADSPRSLTAYELDGTAHALSMSLPADEQVVAFKVSRDGTRLVMLLDAAGTTHLFVAAIIRDSKHAPTGLGDPLELTPPAGDPVGVTWVDDNTVATLSTSTSGDSLVSEQDIGGETTDLGRPSSPGVSIVGGNGVDRVRVMTVTGDLLEPRGNGWQDSGVTTDLLATQR